MKFKAQLELQNVNNGPEMNGEEVGDIRNDLKLTGTVSAEDLVGLFDHEAEYQAILGSLYDTKGVILAQGLSITLDKKFEKVSATLDGDFGGGIEFSDAKLNNFTLTPMNGREVGVECRLQVKPNGEQLVTLIHKMLRHHVSLKAHGRLQKAEDKQGKLHLDRSEKKGKGGKQDDARTLN